MHSGTSRSRTGSWRRPGRANAPLAQRAAAWGFRAAAAGLRSLPPVVSYALADAAVPAILAWTLLHERRVSPRGRGFLRNQRIVYRERLSRRLSWRLTLAWVRHLARLAVDFCRLPRLDADNAGLSVDLCDFDALRALAAEGRGLICVSGHIGVWELCGHVPSVLGVPVSVAVRRLANRPLDAAVREIRSCGGQRLHDKRGALWPLVKALGRGEVIGLLADEDTPANPVFAPFLGTLAATSPAAAFLQRVTGAPIAVVACHRTARARFRLRSWRVIRHAPSASRDADLRAVTGEINEALSHAILAHPAQWLWGSRRFATRPPDERAGADGLPPRVTTAPSDAAAH